MPEDIVRGRTTHALERISRTKPEQLVVHLDELVSLRHDPLPEVRFHLAMLFGNLLIYADQAERLKTVLLEITRSRVISSLCILGRKYPQQREVILQVLVPLIQDRSAAIRARVKKAIVLLTDERLPFPSGWIKSEHLRGDINQPPSAFHLGIDGGILRQSPS